MRQSVVHWVEGRDGLALDARVDVDRFSVVLHSRGGATGGQPRRNTQYELALHEICRRGKAANAFVRILIDSEPARRLPEEDRVLLNEPEIEVLGTDELVAAIRSRLRRFGQNGEVTGGNSTKRVRFDLKYGTPVQMLRLRVDPPAKASLADAPEQVDDPIEIAAILDGVDDDEARRFAEGSKFRALHLKRERNHALVAAFKAAFLECHGRFICQDCDNDWINEYGTDIASACFEAHHAAVQLADMDEDHESSLSDLRLLCANCHRAEHRRMKLGIA